MVRSSAAASTWGARVASQARSWEDVGGPGELGVEPQRAGEREQVGVGDGRREQRVGDLLEPLAAASAEDEVGYGLSPI